MPQTMLPSREKGERNLDLSLYRFIPRWITPTWIDGERWRRVVHNQPIAIICRETLIANLEALDWKIQPKDSNLRDELKEEVKYYTDFLTDDGELDFSSHLEWIAGDMLDLPFGGAAEVGREGDVPEGRVLWVDPLDGATLYPTLNKDFPVGQVVPDYPATAVSFPAHAINRIYMSPRSSIRRKGWGMAPPEKIYLALEMLSRGDIYYANLLLDTPEAGILDLGDMEKSSAETWVESFRSLLGGIDPFKIPVLYEHTTPVKFMPFGKPPTDLMYDRISLKQAALVCAGYGLTLSDIGLGGSSSGNGGETMAGTIRQERKTRKTGYAVVKKKLALYFGRFLIPELGFSWIDYDDELNVALGRARLSNATAFSQMIKDRYITPKEARLQTIGDGMITISIPEEIPEDDLADLPASNVPSERPGLLGYPKPPSSGGYGEVKSETLEEKSAAQTIMERVWKIQFENLIGQASDVRIRRLVRKAAEGVYHEVVSALKELSVAEDINLWNLWHDKVLFGKEPAPEEVTKALDELYDELDPSMVEDSWWSSDPDMDEIIAALTSAYLEELRHSATQLVEDLYENGYLSSPYMQPNEIFEITSSRVIDYLKEKASEMVQNVNDGTKYYLKRILISGVRNGLTDPEIVAKIRAGVDIDAILSDNKFMQKLSSAIRQEIADMTDARIKGIVTYELRRAENQARLDQYTQAGLTKKGWEHIGSDEPCEHCISNISAGFVPLDFEYRGVFGLIKAPPAHPHEHCRLKYDKDELHSAFENKNFKIWTGD